MTDARISQAHLEALVSSTPDARVSQAHLEALVSATPDVRVSQAFVEVMVSYSGVTQKYGFGRILN